MVQTATLQPWSARRLNSRPSSPVGDTCTQLSLTSQLFCRPDLTCRFSGVSRQAAATSLSTSALCSPRSANMAPSAARQAGLLSWAEQLRLEYSLSWSPPPSCQAGLAACPGCSPSAGRRARPGRSPPPRIVGLQYLRPSPPTLCGNTPGQRSRVCSTEDCTTPYQGAVLVEYDEAGCEGQARLCCAVLHWVPLYRQPPESAD